MKSAWLIILLSLASLVRADADAPWLSGYRLRYTLRVVETAAGPSPRTVVAAIPAGSWIDDATSLVVRAPDGSLLPVAVVAHDPLGDTLIRFPHVGGSESYHVYLLPAAGVTAPPAGSAAVDPRTADEGIFAQVRDFEGELSDWASVRQGMIAGAVQGHAWVGEVAHYSNPAQPQHSTNFAISYRGHLRIQKAGRYRFAANGDHATFLFLDGQLLHERPGSKPMVQGNVPISALGAAIDLNAGVYPFEYHQAVGPSSEVSGAGMLLWMEPGQAQRWSPVPRDAFVQALLAEPVQLESAPAGQAAAFVYGVQDYIPVGGFDLFLVRFEAVGAIAQPQSLRWDFGDGQVAVGRSVTHLYFGSGTYRVSLDSGDSLPAHQRRIAVWAPPGQTSPSALTEAVQRLSELDLQRCDDLHLGQMFAFLLKADIPQRWAVLEKVAGHGLSRPGLDMEHRARLHEAQVQAVAQQGRVAEALALADGAVGQFEQIDSLAASLMLTAADVQRDLGGHAQDAVVRYRAILERFRRVDAPVVRLAAIHLGDLYARHGDLEAARQAYENAEQLGGPQFDKSITATAVLRGANLRLVEQKLRQGEVNFARRLLRSIEMQTPQQKAEGLYQFLSAEADRAAGLYERAVQGYEMVLASPQWSGYRDRAMLGLVDCHDQSGRVQEALHWLDVLEKTEPDFFALHQLGPRRQQLQQRQGDDHGKKSQPFGLNFEAQEAWPSAAAPMRVQALGIAAPGVWWSSAAMGAGPATLSLPIGEQAKAARYDLRFWYRTSLGNVAATGRPAFSAGLQADDPAAFAAEPWPVWGQWVHDGTVLNVNDSATMHLTLQAQRFAGLLQVDGIQVRPVSARVVDAWNRFLDPEFEP